MTDLNSSNHPLERLEFLYRLSQTFNSSLDLSEVLNRVIDEVITKLRAERGFIMLIDSAGTQTFRVARGLDQQTIDKPQSQISQSVVRKVAQEGQAILTSDARTDSRFNMRDSVMLLGLRSVLCVPLKVKDNVMGVVYADNRFEAGIFTQADCRVGRMKGNLRCCIYLQNTVGRNNLMPATAHNCMILISRKCSYGVDNLQGRSLCSDICTVIGEKAES